MKIIRYEQEGDQFILYFELENKDQVNSIRSFSVYPEYQELIDQNSNVYRSTRCKIGNLDYNTGNLPVKLVSGNATPGLVEFKVGGNKISKIQYLKIGLDINYFEFSNISL